MHIPADQHYRTCLRRTQAIYLKEVSSAMLAWVSIVREASVERHIQIFDYIDNIDKYIDHISDGQTSFCTRSLMKLDMVPTKNASEKFTSLFKDYDLSLFGKRFSTVHGYLIIQTTCNMLNLAPKILSRRYNVISHLIYQKVSSILNA